MQLTAVSWSLAGDNTDKGMPLPSSQSVSMVVGPNFSFEFLFFTKNVP